MMSSLSCDSLVNWLLGSLRLETTVFHAGRYCGTWQASTAGKLLGSFHLVLDGVCWLHRPGHASVRLGPRDSVLFLRDVPHCLSSDPDGATPAVAVAMQPLDAPSRDAGTGLACGFFQFCGAMTHLLVYSLPEMILVRADDAGGERLATLFAWIRVEAGTDPDQPSPLLARLVEVLFFQAIRAAVLQGRQGMPGLWNLARHPRLSPLLADLLARPGQDWTVASMAAHIHMSRTNFCRQFVEATGQSPAAFLALLRMRVAAQRLESGDNIENVADHVGYRSSAAFSRAFKKIVGEQPGAWRRGERATQSRSLLQ